MTTSSPLTFDIYGYCGISILSEFFHHGDIEKLVIPNSGYRKIGTFDQTAGVRPQNQFTAQEKLVMALEMAKGLAVLHGYKNGIIVHDDVQLSQYLFNEDFSVLKLNDFNRAEFMLWDEGKNAYCLYQNGRGHGNVCFWV